MCASEIKTLFQKGPDFSSMLLAEVPKGTTQFIVTLSWQGDGSINVMIESSSKNYTEDMVPVYQRTFYSSSSGDRSIRGSCCLLACVEDCGDARALTGLKEKNLQPSSSSENYISDLSV